MILLPLLNLAGWVALVLVPTTFIFLHMKQMAHGAPVLSMRAGPFEARIPQKHFLTFALNTATMSTGQAVAAANVPAFLIEILVSLPTTWPQTYHPSTIMFLAWCALAFPIFALPAWWYVGRGIDALRNQNHLSILDLVFSSSCAVLLAILAIGLRFGLSESDRDSITSWYIAGLALWAGLMGLTAVAWIKQWKRKRVAAISTG